MDLVVFFGGRSYEHEVSIVSAIALKDILVRLKYFIFIDSQGCLYNIPLEKMQAKTFSSNSYKKCPQVFLTHRGFMQKKLFKEEFMSIQMAINLIHGAEGEDGTLSSLLNFYCIPYIGPRIESCVLSFNKYFTKLYAHSRKVLTMPYKVFDKDKRKHIAQESLPFIIKPLCLGSSLGVEVVEHLSDIDYKLDIAFEFDDRVIVEPFIHGIKEYNLAGCLIKKEQGYEYKFSVIEEPQKDNILDFKKKYLDFSRTQKVCGADIDSELAQNIYDNFIKIYHNCFEGALIRCDFFVHENQVYLNEINPIPGSLAHYLFDDFPALIDALAHSIPTVRSIPINYHFIHQIHAHKGK